MAKLVTPSGSLPSLTMGMRSSMQRLTCACPIRSCMRPAEHLHQRHWVDPARLPDSSQVAAVGFSEGLRAELCRGPVTVTTVIPGLMRTGSHLQARFTGQAGKEFT